MKTISLYSLLLTLVAALLISLVFTKCSTTLVKNSITDFWKTLLMGLVLLVIVPIVVVLCFMTIVGVLIGVIILLMYILAIIIGSVYGGIILGSLLFKHLSGKKKKDIKLTWYTALIGVIVLHALSLIPFVGWIIGFVFFLVGLGSIGKILYGNGCCCKK